MANQTPLSTILALFGATCHYLEVTAKTLIFFPPYIATSSAMLSVLMIINVTLAVGYCVFAWHLLGWSGKALKLVGTGLDRLHIIIGDVAVRSLRYVAWNVMRRTRMLVRWLK